MGGSDAPMPYQPAHQGQADSAYYSTLSGLTGNNQKTYNTADAGFNAVYDNIRNNPYNKQAMDGTVAAANTAKGIAANDLADAGTMRGDAGSLRSYVPGVMAAGFDPLSANYNWNLRGATDAQKIANAESGIAGSPFGASLVNDAGQGFTREWQAGQQARQMQALDAIAKLFSGASGLDKSASDLGHRGAESQAAAAILPQQTYYDIQNETLAALTALVDGLGTASKPLAGDVGQWGQYLQLGQSSTQIADQATQINNAQGGILGGLGSLFGLGTKGGGTVGGDLFSSIGLL